VTAIAVCANEFIVHVVRLVARKTFLRSVPMLLTIVMTARAGYLRVTTEQLEICKVVIEVLLDQVDDVRIPAQVILVAGCTARWQELHSVSTSACPSMTLPGMTSVSI